jgi:Ca2+-binding RTX toxin-like protein
MGDATMAGIDWEGILQHETGKKWEGAEGLKTGVGVDYYYAEVGGDDVAWLNVDQEYITFVLEPRSRGTEERILFSGTYEDFLEHPEYARFAPESSLAP